MKVRVGLLQPFRSRIGKRSIEVEAKKGNVASVLETLCTVHPEVKGDIMPEGSVGADVCVVLNGTPLASDRPYAKVKVSGSDDLLIFLPVSGG